MPFHSCERQAGFSPLRKWRPQLAPLPPLPHPPHRGSDSSTGTSTQEDQRDLWRLQSNVLEDSQPGQDARTHGRGDARFSAWTPIFHRERCCHKIITIQSEERETNTMKLPSEPGNSFHWSSKEHVVLTHQTAKRVGKQQLS